MAEKIDIFAAKKAKKEKVSESKTLNARIEALRAKSVLDFRPIEPLTGFEVAPNKITSKPPEPITLRPEELYVDASYQRSLSRKSFRLILDIITNWSWQKFKPPVVTRDAKGRWVVIDGQHTSIAAATHPDIKEIPVLFVPMESVEEQAGAFIGHNTARISVTPLDLFHAKITAGDEAAITVKAILDQYGVTVVRNVPSVNGDWEANATLATGTLMKLLARRGKAELSRIVEMASQCNYKPLRANHLTAWELMLYGPDRQRYMPEEMVLLVRSLHDGEAHTQANRIKLATDLTLAQGLATYYKAEYRKVHQET